MLHSYQYTETALTLAVRRCEHAVQILLKAGVVPTHEALLLAVGRRSFEVVKCLLEAGADVHEYKVPNETVLKDLMANISFGRSMSAKVFDDAAEDKNTDISEILVEHGAMLGFNKLRMVSFMEKQKLCFFTGESEVDVEDLSFIAQFSEEFKKLEKQLAVKHQKFIKSKFVEYQALLFQAVALVISAPPVCQLILDYDARIASASDDTNKLEAIAGKVQAMQRAERRGAVHEIEVGMCDSCVSRSGRRT